MKELINEELNYMKYLFGYQRGKVVSEQYNPQLNPDGCEKEYYRDCTTKTCVKKPKGSTIAYSKEEFDKKQEIYEFSKEHNRKGLHYIKVHNEWSKKSGWSYVQTPEKTLKGPDSFVGLPSGKEKVVKGKPIYYDGRKYDSFDITNTNPSDCTANVKLSSYENNLKKRDFKLSGMCVRIDDKCEGHYYPLLIISKPILACVQSGTTSSGTTEPIPTVKIENINQITKVEDFPKDFVLSGDYRCSGTNSLGYKSQPSTFEQQCMDLPSSMKTFDKLSAWEIKFPPNVAGNPKTVPVTRWDFIWDSQGKIKEIKMQNFNKIGKEEQVVYDNLLSQKSSDENLKAFMKIAYGSDDNYNERVGNLLK